MPSTGCFGRTTPVKKRLMTISALRSPASVRVTDVAWTRTSSSSSAGTGRSTSSRRWTSADRIVVDDRPHALITA